MAKWDYQSLGVASAGKHGSETSYAINIDGDRVNVEVEGPNGLDTFAVKVTPGLASEFQYVMEMLLELHREQDS